MNTALPIIALAVMVLTVLVVFCLGVDILVAWGERRNSRKKHNYSRGARRP
jgi:hypothetical protein